MDKFKSINPENTIINKEDINKTIEELRINAYESLYSRAENEIGMNKPTTDDEVIEYENAIREKMKDNLRIMNNTPEQRAKMYLASNKMPETSEAISEMATLLDDRMIGVRGYKDLMDYVRKNVEDRNEAQNIIDSSLEYVMTLPKLEGPNKQR